MPTEHDYIDVRDLFASINPNGLDEKDLARDGASFVEPHTINDYHLFRAGYQAALEAQQGQGESIRLTAVATLEEDGDGGLEPNWLLEGGTAELLAGMTLLVADNAPHLCDDDGSAQVYTHADPAALQRSWQAGYHTAWYAKNPADKRTSVNPSDPAEVERLRQKVSDLTVSGHQEYMRCEKMRSQLSEAQALLLELEGDHTLMLQMGASEFGPKECKTLRARLAKLRTYLRANVLCAAETLAALSASAEPSAPLPPVDGDLLPTIGSKVLIHLGREDKWVEHTVVGYYAWGNHGLEQNVHRVFVRVRDAEGYLNARLLSAVRPVDAGPHQL